MESFLEDTCGEFRGERWKGRTGRVREGGNCDERGRVKELRMRVTTRVTSRVKLVNILSWTLINTLMVVSVRARQDQTPSYEELGETKR